MRALALCAWLIGCGAATPHTAPSPPTTTTTTPARFAGHGPVTLRSRTAVTQPPFYAELAADGSVTGTRCGATRFTDEGVLEREGAAVARVSDALAIETADGTPTGWRIEGDGLTGSGFTLASGVITASDAEVPAISVDPVTSESTLVLALFATLLVCDDAGP